MWKDLLGLKVDIKAILDLLDWKKLFQCFVFVIIMGLGYAIYELHGDIAAYLRQNVFTTVKQEVTISKTNRSKLIKLVSGSDLIAAITVATVDFQRNTRTIVYTAITDPEFREIYNFYMERRPGEFPLFIKEYPRGNDLLISTMNSDFGCDQWTYAYIVIPESKKYIKEVCAYSIPPVYGKYNGLLAVYLKRIPTSDEVEWLKRTIREMSQELYDKDFK